jgi:hypothetical protein
MAELASDPDVRRRHQELAELHAIRASLFPKSDKASSQVAAD